MLYMHLIWPNFFLVFYMKEFGLQNWTRFLKGNKNKRKLNFLWTLDNLIDLTNQRDNAFWKSLSYFRWTNKISVGMALKWWVLI